MSTTVKNSIITKTLQFFIYFVCALCEKGGEGKVGGLEVIN